MSSKALMTGIIILAIFGIADSVYLAVHEVTNTALSCGIGNLSGCNVVAQSAYSKLFGIPLGIYGLIFYVLTLAVGAIYYASPKHSLSILVILIAKVGFLFSLYFLGLQLFVIHAICIYCLGSFILATLIYLAAIPIYMRSRRSLRT